jgi:hypothetical protein
MAGEDIASLTDSAIPQFRNSHFRNSHFHLRYDSDGQLAHAGYDALDQTAKEAFSG